MTSSPRTTMRRRNLVRTSAIAAVAGSALLLPAAAAFADNPAPENSTIPNAEQGKKQDDAQHQDKGGQEKDGQDKGSQDKSGQDKDKNGRDKSGQDKDKKAERKLIRTQNLAGGFTAKVYKLGQNHFQADMYAKAPDTGKLVKYDTLETKGGKPAYGQHNGAHFVLQPDGSMSSWVEGGKKQDHKKPDHNKSGHKDAKGKNGNGTKNSQGKVIPKGGVKAGAEGVEPADHTLLAAGGGAAAAAAGLGFTVLHRRRVAGRSGDNG
ncbi:hypothetical protein ACFVFQ_00230 [Streptomyces sp. NPDC057743]|uniref:hypothetical protein n=1 Tax=Streptomyces sp. NPDC057743 TaxID=3346236 RepID=UPI0036AFF271